MSLAYNRYLDEHIANVQRAFEWMHANLSEVFEGLERDVDVWEVIKRHDESKYTPEEYDAYDDYFYGKNHTGVVDKEFKHAWLHHIHKNDHHWQHYVLINDEPNEGIVALDMPYYYIIEMICDWWSFSWKTGNLSEIFKWYLVHKDHMKLSDKTRNAVEDILGKIKDKLDELGFYEDDE